MMKTAVRILSALLAAVLLLGACPALGEPKGFTITFDGPVTLPEGQTAKIKTAVGAVKSGTIVYSLTDMVRKTVIYTETRTGVKAKQELTWPVIYDIEGLDASHPIKQVRASFVMDDKVYHLDLYYHYPTGQTAGITIEKADWFPNNTACSAGLFFREVRPALTDKWYNFTPVDLTVQGRQEIDYVASNMYIIGKVYVDVDEDSVTVTYYNYYASKKGATETKEEFFTFFHDLASVSKVEPQDLKDQAFAFGVPVSIEKDLDGDTNVLLFVRNKVTYCNYPTATNKLNRYWPNSAERREIKKELTALMNQ